MSWFARWKKEQQQEINVEQKMSEEAQATRGGIEDDFTMMKLVYEAVKAIPEKRRDSVFGFVMQRLEYERKEAQDAIFSTRIAGLEDKVNKLG